MHVTTHSDFLPTVQQGARNQLFQEKQEFHVGSNFSVELQTSSLTEQLQRALHTALL